MDWKNITVLHCCVQLLQDSQTGVKGVCTMKVATIQISGVYAAVTQQKRIPAGIAGAEIHVEFDSHWEGLTKTAVFQAEREGEWVTKDVLVTGERIRIPAETTQQPCGRLNVGFYGVNEEGSIVIPTFWVDLGRVYYAADPSGDESTDSTLPVWAQLAARLDGMPKGNLITQVLERETESDGRTGREVKLVYTDGTETVIICYDGQSGKDAYAYATAAGYSGTEEEFGRKLAAEAVLYEAQQLAEVQKQQARENIGAMAADAEILPQVTAEDEGKSLRVVEGKWAAAEETGAMGLPEIGTEDTGKVLVAVDGQWVAIKVDIPEGLPRVTSEDEGKILQVVGGQWSPAAVADSAVAAYIDDYIRTALEGDY